jgi:hypothetical protein
MSIDDTCDGCDKKLDESMPMSFSDFGIFCSQTCLDRYMKAHPERVEEAAKEYEALKKSEDEDGDL